MTDCKNKAYSGISVAICFHNAANRIEDTLSCLIAQVIPHDLLWEVILIDNASTDNTVEIASDYWGKYSNLPLRIIHENKQGLIYARKKAILESKFSYICFVDDDNLLSSNYLANAFSIMQKNPNIGILGGEVKEQCEIAPHTWFWQFLPSYAIGRQLPYGVKEGRCDSVCGASCIVNKEAWLQLDKSNIKITSIGRNGESLSSGDDTEICFAFRLLGWEIYCDNRLVIRHFIPANRLTWSYYKRLVFNFGKTSIAYVPYLEIINNGVKNVNPLSLTIKSYLSIFMSITCIIRETLCFWLSVNRSDESYRHQANIYFKLGYLIEVLTHGYRIYKRTLELTNILKNRN